jgi:hypothetical protein
MKIWCSIVLTLVLTSAFSATVMAHAWIDGVWKGKITIGQVEEEITVIIDGESNELYGKVSGNGWESPFKNGYFDDSESVTFYTKETHNNKLVDVFYDGAVRPDRINFARHIPGIGRTSFTVRRPE